MKARDHGRAGGNGAQAGSGGLDQRQLLSVLEAVRAGDFRVRMQAADGQAGEIVEALNAIIGMNAALCEELKQVGRAVGKEGRITRGVSIPGSAGMWAECVAAVNTLIGDLLQPTIEVARVIGAVARGDLSQRMGGDSYQRPLHGQFSRLAGVVDAMVDQLGSFASEVTRVAREVGTEGKLGGQAQVRGVAGTWKDLTDNVNQLAANLTSQVRAIAEVSTAVTKGDLTRSITVKAQGEVAALKDNINEMIRNLRATTEINTQQNWLKTNLARFSQMMQGQRDLLTVSRLIMSELAPLVEAHHGVFYVYEVEEGEPVLTLTGSYARRERTGTPSRFRLGESLIGQCALEKKKILMTKVPRDYVRISSGVGEAPLRSVVVLPVLFEDQVKAVIELGSFGEFSEIHMAFLDQLTGSIGIVLNNIAVNMRTESLLGQSQSLADKLQRQQEELQKTNAELQQKARLLSEQNREVEVKNREIELAKRDIEEKAEQLALTSKYKSEFLANMSHELRTPLNSLLILAKLLIENSERNLSEKQVQFARTIYSAGTDLLALINDVLDLSKIESGTMAIHIGDLPVRALADYVEQNFRHVAQQKGLDFAVVVEKSASEAVQTDERRLQQVLRNLLSNAFKFTERGKVELRVSVAREGWSHGNERLNKAGKVLAFAVADTGIGIPADKQRIIFEAFQQAEGGISRKYGGTGLGLSISREIAQLLGGEIRVQSSPGKGSCFTLYLPQPYLPPAAEGSSAAPPEAEAAGLVRDDRGKIKPRDPVLLIVTGEPAAARAQLATARAAGFKGLISPQAATGLALAREFKPTAVVAAAQLPDMGGRVLLDLLKRDTATRHIPVFITGAEEGGLGERRLGALAAWPLPEDAAALAGALAAAKRLSERKERRVLVLDPRGGGREAAELLAEAPVRVRAAATAEAALGELRKEPVDCLIAAPGGLPLLARIAPEAAGLPVIAQGTPQDAGLLGKAAGALALRWSAEPDRLLETCALFLHLADEDWPESKRRLFEGLRRSDPDLAGKRALVVDDDVRNIFAITSFLELHKMEVLHAESGLEAIEKARSRADIDVVIMDIMMPDMDGYETIRRMRRVPALRTLPIIALTAKAMKGDREKCIGAGASDYISKPVDTERLISLIRIWLSR